MAGLYKRGKTFWVIYRIGGQLIRKSLETKNERVARSKFRQMEYEIALGDLQVTTEIPLSAFLETFCQHLIATRTFKSYKNDISRLRVFFGVICESLRPGIPGVKWTTKNAGVFFDKYANKHVQAELLEDITPQMINRFLADRIAQNGWSAKTANLMRQTLHKLFNYAMKYHNFRSRDRRFPNPAAGVERRTESAPQIRFLNLDDIQHQLEILEEYPLIRVMAATYIYAGLRREEGLWLTHEDIDLQKRHIRIRAKTINGEIWQPKTKRNRLVPISQSLYDILNSYKSASNCEWFFPSPTGKRWNPDNFSSDLREINSANGLDWSCLDFRHTFGSHLAQKGESLYKISTLMGNSPDMRQD